jgi:hypothetical protein
MAVTVNLDDGGVDHGVFHIQIISHRIENTFENIGFDPVTIARVGSAPVPEYCRQITPWTTC